MLKKALSLVAVLLLTLAVTPATAGPLTVSSISGTWQNVVGGANVQGLGTSFVTWGYADRTISSGYNFVAAAVPFNPPLGFAFKLGTFTHINKPITAGTAISAVDLSLGLGTNGVPTPIFATFNFNHNETPNVPPNPEDIVTITTPIVNALITQGADSYYFNMLGFYQGNAYTTSFSSPEGGSNSADLYGILREVPTDPVPEPASLLLLGTGLVGAAIRRRKRQ